MAISEKIIPDRRTRRRSTLVRISMNNLASQDGEESSAEFVTGLRNSSTTRFQPMQDDPIFTPILAQITSTELRVPTFHDGSYEVLVEVYTPSALEDEACRPCFIYAHGGGCVAGTAAESRPFMAHIAVSCNVVVFNVEYRLAPETKCPNNVLDFYECVKYISSHAESLGVDPARVCIGGESGGGYICQAAAVVLAERGEAGLVKLLLPGVPMTSDYHFGDLEQMTEEEKGCNVVMRCVYKLIASDFEKQRDSPLLFPGKVSNEILAKFPPTLIYTVEHDMFITETRDFVERLRKAGRLVEFVVFSGVQHSAVLKPEYRVGEVFEGTLRRVLSEHLIK